jgi:hypothetical protein
MNESQDLTPATEGTPRMSRGRRSAFAVAGATALAGGIMVMAALGGTSTAGAAPKAPTKYFVCKYVGTPGDDERLQTGQNPISVSKNAIPEQPVVIGSFFADKQGRSLVLALDTGQPKPPRSACNLAQPTDTPTPTLSDTPTPTETPSPTETVITDTATVSGTITEVVTTTEAAGAAGAGPIPAGVNAGLHTTDSNAGLKAWGILLMLLGGVAGLIMGLRPASRRVH